MRNRPSPAGSSGAPPKGELYTIDLESGVATFVVELSGRGVFRAIEFGPDGKLYGSVTRQDLTFPFPRIFFRIDDVPSGEYISLFESEPGTIYGLTCGPFPDTLG